MSPIKKNDHHLKIGIVGAGISGMCTAIQLQEQLGIQDYVIIDENHDVGGTWLVNTYPGCACDIPSHFFSYSFEPNPNWSESFSSQPEILSYLQSVARKYDLYKKIKFKHRVTKCLWDETISKWRVSIQNQKGQLSEHLMDIVISCLGGLRVPLIPNEFDAFKGLKIHSAQWDHKIKLKNKKVAIVGTGASAVQIIPKIVDDVKSLAVYQRNPPWVVPRMQFSFPSWLQWTFTNIPGVQKGFRSLIFALYEISHNIYMKDSTLGKLGESLGKYHLKKEFKKDDETLKNEMIPKYRMGCKRITPSDEYYDSLSQPHVKVITGKITQVKPRSIITENGQEENIDVLILATGFRVQDFFSPLEIVGKGSANIMKLWKEEGPSSYLGMCTSVMPNAFFVIGPNAAPGNTSIIFTVECQVNWLMQVLKEMIKKRSTIVSVDETAEKRHMTKLLSEIKNTVWSEDCGSYYRDHRGVVTALIPDSGLSYWRQTRTPNFDHLIFN